MGRLAEAHAQLERSGSAAKLAESRYQSEVRGLIGMQSSCGLLDPSANAQSKQHGALMALVNRAISLTGGRHAPAARRGAQARGGAARRSPPMRSGGEREAQRCAARERWQSGEAARGAHAVSAIACNLLATDDARHSTQRAERGTQHATPRCARGEAAHRLQPPVPTSPCDQHCRLKPLAGTPRLPVRSLIGSHKLAAPTSEHCRTAVAV